MPEIQIYRPDKAEAAVLAPIISAWTVSSSRQGEAVLPQSETVLAAQIAQGLSLIATLDGQLAGHITTYPLTAKYYEVGTLYSHFRHLGVGRSLASAVSQLHPESYLVATTKNPDAIAIFQSENYVKTPYPDIPVAARESLCYQAPCFIQNGHPNSCVREHNLGGPCFAYVRPPLT